MKVRQDNDVTNRISLVYPKIETDLSRPIQLGAFSDENQIGQ